MSEIRTEVYRDLHDGQLASDMAQTRASARRILGILFEYLTPKSVLDVGCGLGGWLEVAAAMGIAETQGIEGMWLDPARACIDPRKITRLDLEAGFSLGRRYDLVMCMEVAEHLSPAAADRLVTALTEHGPVVLFSAAIPFQGGHHHVNEQFADYWVERFRRHGYRPADVVRGHIWNDASVLWWLRQNTLLFVHESVLASNERLRRETEVVRPLSVVLPDVYLGRIHQRDAVVTEHQQLMTLLSQGGTFTTSQSADGRLSVHRHAG